jgi:uncharacterized SAM-binding protein YcdF (DUF218 family)
VVPAILKELFAPASYPFFLFMLAVGIALLFRRKDGGRLGQRWLTLLVVAYWLLSTPVVAVNLVKLTTSDFVVRTRTDARDASAIVVLGAGMQVHRSRGDLYEAASREGALRVLEAFRLYRLLDPPWVLVSGGLGTERHTEGALMAEQLEQLGVPAQRIIRETRATNTRDHALFIPRMLADHGVSQFVLVTSRPHMARSLAAFAAVGVTPIPSCPEVYVWQKERFRDYLPSQIGLFISEQLLYDGSAVIYYELRGWL